MSLKLYSGRWPIYRPYIYRNPIISQVLSLYNPLKLFALKGRFAPARGVSIPDTLFTAGEYRDPSRVVKSGKPAKLSSLPFIAMDPISLVIVDPEWGFNNTDEAGRTALSELFLDFIPTELVYTPSSTLTPLKIIGRNNAPLHFAGSSDTLEIKVDWYGTLNSPVIEKCRFVESLCKADGWSSGPPVVQLTWGHQGRMFEDHYFAVTKAPYTMKTFTSAKTLVRSDGSISNPYYHLWPVHATQNITLKRVSSTQLTHKEIRRF